MLDFDIVGQLQKINNKPTQRRPDLSPKRKLMMKINKLPSALQHFKKAIILLFAYFSKERRGDLCDGNKSFK